MSPGKAINVAELAQKILDKVVQHYAADVHPYSQALPDRRYVAPGDSAAVAWDCEQLTVAIIGVGAGWAPDSGSSTARTGTPASVFGLRHAVYSITLVRCTPTVEEDGDAPPADLLHTAGLHYLRDVGLVSQALVEAGAEAKRLSQGAVVTAGNVQPVGPAGGFVGLEGQLTITTSELT